MREETIRTLITARALFESANPLCLSEISSSASAGLIILQDAIELVFIACLRHLDIDKKRNIDDLGIDKMMQAFQDEKQISILKRDKIRALNKQRVIVKHFGQNADVATVKEYHVAALEAVDDLLIKVIGQPLDEIMLHQLILSEDTKKAVQAAIEFINQSEWFEALAAIRMALFIEVENEYNIYTWKDDEGGASILGLLLKGGMKAPWHTRKKEWIEKNVSTPFEYIQLDHEKLKIDLMEWGVPTQDYWNIWRLTPAVFRRDKKSEWVKEGEVVKHLAATEENARYCLDRLLSIILKKQSHLDSRKWIRDTARFLNVHTLDSQKVYEKSSLNSEIIGETDSDIIYDADLFTPSLDLDTDDEFVRIRNPIERNRSLEWYTGYVLADKCKIVVESTEEAASESLESASS